MSFQMNQFEMSDKAGKTMNINPDTITCRVSSDEATALVPGDVIKFVSDEVGGAPVITKISAGELGDGVILDNPRQPSFAAKQMVEVGLTGTIVTMTAGTAFNRGDVAYNPSTGYVSGTTGTRNGVAMDISLATGDIVRVLFSPKEDAIIAE